jgi:hypothetical protein
LGDSRRTGGSQERVLTYDLPIIDLWPTRYWPMTDRYWLLTDQSIDLWPTGLLTFDLPRKMNLSIKNRSILGYQQPANLILTFFNQ